MTELIIGIILGLLLLLIAVIAVAWFTVVLIEGIEQSELDAEDDWRG